MTTFSHSGTHGDLIYSLNIAKYLGGGDFYLRLNNMDNMAKKTFGPHANAGDHAGEMTEKQFHGLSDFMKSQPYVNSWNVWNGEAIDYALEDSGTEIVKQQGNYTFAYARSVGVDPMQNYNYFMLQPWLTVKDPIKVPGKPIVINRVNRHLYGCDPEAKNWRSLFNRGLAETAVYVGMPDEHAWFEDFFKVKVEHYRTYDILELARVIAGSEQFVGSQSLCLSLAVGLGKTFLCECRKDLPPQNNECYFVRPNAHYF
jgi:hypothetical protein